MAANVGTLTVELMAQTDQFMRGMQRARTALEGMRRQITAMGGATANLRASMNRTGSSFGLLADAASAASVAVKGLLTGFAARTMGNWVKQASDVEETLNAVQVAFKELTPEVQRWAKEQSDALGRSEAQMLQFAASTQLLLKNLLGNNKAAADWSKRLSVLAVDLASLFNATDTEALQALQSAIKGEFDPLERFGVSLNVATLEAYALKQGIKETWSEMNQATRTLLVLNAIMDQTRDAQGDAARTAASYANQTKRLQGNLQGVAVVLGRHLLPAATAFLKTANRLLESFLAAPTWLQGTVSVLFAVATAGFGVVTVLGAMAKALPWVIGLWAKGATVLRAFFGVLFGFGITGNLLNKGISLFGMAFLDFVGIIATLHVKVKAAFAAIIAVAKMAAAAVLPTLASMAAAIKAAASAAVAFVAANPIILALVAAVALLAAGAYLLWRNWDKVKKKAEEWKDSLFAFFGGFGQFPPMIGGAMKAAARAVTDTWRSLTNWLTSTFQTLRQRASATWTGMSMALAAASRASSQQVITIWAAIKTWFANLWNSFLESATAVWDKVLREWSTQWESIKQALEQAWSTIASVLDPQVIVDAVNDAWDLARIWTRTKWYEIRDVLREFWNTKIAPALDPQPIVDAITSAWDLARINMRVKLYEIRDAAREFWEQQFVPIFSGLQIDLAGAFERAKQGAVQVWNSITAEANQWWSSLVGIFTGLRVDLATPFEEAHNALSQTLSNIYTTLWSMWEASKTLTSGSWEQIRNAVSDGWETVTQGVGKAASLLHTTLSSWWMTIVNTTDSTWNSVRDAVGRGWSEVTTTVGGAVGLLHSTITSWWASIANATDATWNAVRDAVQRSWDAVKSGVTRTVSALVSELSGLFEELKKGAQESWDAIREAIQAAWDRVTDGVQDTIAALVSALQSQFRDVRDKAVEYWDAARKAVQDGWEKVKKQAAGWNTALHTSLEKKWEELSRTAQETWDSIRSSVSSGWETVKTSVATAAEQIRLTLTGIWNAIYQHITGSTQLTSTQLKLQWSLTGQELKNALTQTGAELNAITDSSLNQMTQSHNRTWELIKQVADSNGGTLLTLVGATLAAMLLQFQNFSTELVGHSIWTDMWAKIVEVARSATSSLVNFLNTNLFQRLSSEFSAWQKRVGEAWKQFWEVEFGQSARTSIANFISNALANFGDFWNKLRQGAVDWKSFWQSILDGIRQDFSNFVARIIQEGISRLTKAFLDFFVTVGKGAAQFVWDMIKSFATWFAQTAAGALQWLVSLLGTIASAIGSFIAQAYSALVAWFWWLGPGAPAAAAGVIAGAMVALGELVRQAVSAIRGLVGLAEGGIVTGPTIAMIGEAGPEAVIPLDRLPLGGPQIIITGNYILSDRDLEELGDRLIHILHRRGVRLAAAV